MKLTTLLKTLAAALALPSAAFAAEWTSGFYDAPLDYLYSGDTQYGNTFDLTLDGFNPATMQIDTATAWFAFADDGDDSSDDRSWKMEYVDISIEGVNVVNDEEVDGNHSDPWDSYDWVEVSLSQSLIDVLESDGKLSFLVQLTSTYKDTYLKIAHLVATGGDTPPPPSTVPDAGATALLVGLGLSSMVALRRRRG